MATATDFGHKAATERISDDVAHTAIDPGAVHGKLVPPPLVAAMSQEQRVIAEAKMRRKIDTRLLPMIILMYIMNCAYTRGAVRMRIVLERTYSECLRTYTQF
jgi:hypothetical protein